MKYVGPEPLPPLLSHAQTPFLPLVPTKVLHASCAACALLMPVARLFWVPFLNHVWLCGIPQTV